MTYFAPHLSTGEASAEAPETYLERIAKYVPAEVLAFFMFINAILEQAEKTGGKGAAMAGLPVTTGALAVGLLLTPLFVWYVRQEGDAWITNAVVSTAAFPFWAYVLAPSLLMASAMAISQPFFWPRSPA
jgi:hypothetical protein